MDESEIQDVRLQRNRVTICQSVSTKHSLKRSERSEWSSMEPVKHRPQKLKLGTRYQQTEVLNRLNALQLPTPTIVRLMEFTAFEIYIRTFVCVSDMHWDSHNQSISAGERWTECNDVYGKRPLTRQSALDMFISFGNHEKMLTLRDFYTWYKTSMCYPAHGMLTWAHVLDKEQYNPEMMTMKECAACSAPYKGLWASSRYVPDGQLCSSCKRDVRQTCNGLFVIRGIYQ